MSLGMRIGKGYNVGENMMASNFEKNLPILDDASSIPWEINEENPDKIMPVKSNKRKSLVSLLRQYSARARKPSVKKNRDRPVTLTSKGTNNGNDGHKKDFTTWINNLEGV
jgi:hypothetical protein